MDMESVAIRIASRCITLSQHLAWCRKCRKSLRRHKPNRMCKSGHDTVDSILFYIGKFNDNWTMLQRVLEEMS